MNMQLHIRADGMKPKQLAIVVILILISNCFLFSTYIEDCKADVLPKFYVDDDYNSSTPGWQIDHFDKIQDAINASSAEDRIIVYAGIYYERLIIDHKLDLFGEDKNITIINGGDSGDIITINAEYTNISHFKISDSREGSLNTSIVINFGNTIITDNIISNGNNGIFLDYSDNNLIYDNSIKDNNGYGIWLNHSNYNEINYNNIISNSNGIFLYNSSYNSIKNNTNINDNSKNGIFLNETSNYNTITDNIISHNTKNGLFINDRCDHNVLSKNNIYGNDDSGIRSENSSYNWLDNNSINSNINYGVMIVGSSNTIIDNSINNNKEHGIFLFADDNNVITKNEISYNIKDGITLSNSTADSIYKNEISYNYIYGINLDFFTISNTIYDNYLYDNTENAIDKSPGNNIWNITKTLATNIVGGPYIYGNYWGDFDESTEYANDSNADWIADNSYTIYASNKDYGPLLDNTPPIIGTINIHPNVQTLGKYTNISITITDNIVVKEVYLNIINPYNEASNSSITQNKNGNIYYCNKQFNPDGTFIFYIIAKDPRNWVNSTNNTFYINKGTPPKLTDNTPSKGAPLKIFIFNATVTENEGNASNLVVKVKWKHGEKGGNSTLLNTYRNFFEFSEILDNTTDDLTYSFYAYDRWGNSITTIDKVVKVIDNEPPEIRINKHGASSDFMPNKYTFNVTVTDNVNVTDVNIEYWYKNYDHITVEMDSLGNNFYEKNILLNESNDKIFCIIYATDSSGNQNNTKKPFANAGGNYTGIIAIKINFNATDSYDLDGNISKYIWNFGDGTNGSGAIIDHIYTAAGNYTVIVNVTDDDGNTATDLTYVKIIQSAQIKPSNITIDYLESVYNIALAESFYCYDTDGDYVVDNFIDPNNVLKPVYTGIKVGGNILFLISVDDRYIPEFIWKAKTDEIVKIYYKPISITDEDFQINKESEEATLNIFVEKVNWIYIEIEDRYPNSALTIKSRNRIISSDMIIRQNNKIYILDDAETTYTITFVDIYPDLQDPIFYPDDGGIINGDIKTITITYNVPVEIICASFNDLDVKSEIINTNDNMVFTYTPPGYWEDGVYDFSITAKTLAGNIQKTSIITYFYFAYTTAPLPPEKSFIEKNMIWIMLSCIIIISIILLQIAIRKNISFESFVYIKNKKIIPFFKPLVFGPLKIDVNDEKVKKAEFYVNGKLKNTITEPPFVWNWDEKIFMKQKIETIVYDGQGNSDSSGEMTFFVFNSPKFFK
jgi:parallel beta-helix repeat protein